MTANSGRETGFALIVAMIILAVLSVLVINSMRGSTLSERMAFSYMDRALAQQAAEQALREGGAKLIEHAAKCARNEADPSIYGCTVAKDGTVSAAKAPSGADKLHVWSADAVDLPAAWSGTNAVSVTKLTDQKSSGNYEVALLKVDAEPKCWLYSIMGQGKGSDTDNTKVVLQTVARVCSL